jgi:branched-chain amino acid transport system permease protein
MQLRLIRFGVRPGGRTTSPEIPTALEAIAEDEDAAAAAGVHVTAEKLKITVLSAMMTAFAGALYCQYQMFISPDTVSGIGVSLQMVFAAVVGGLCVPLGPTVGAAITILLTETL